MTREEAIIRIKDRLDKMAWCIDEEDRKALATAIPEVVELDYNIIIEEAATSAADMMAADMKDSPVSSRMDFWTGAYCGFKSGAGWQRLQTMKGKAVAGEVAKVMDNGVVSIHYLAPKGIGTMSYFYDAEDLKLGDKVKLIIVKDIDYAKTLVEHRG